jgi:hypothetical protein
MLSTELVYLSTGLEWFLQGWNTFDRVDIPLYRVRIPLYRVEMLSTGLEYFLQCGNTFVHS